MRTLHTPQPFEANPSNASAKFVSGRANKRLSQCAVSKGLARRGTASGEFATLFPRRSARSVLSAKIFAAKAATKPVESTPEASIASIASLPIFCTDRFRPTVRMKGLEPPGADGYFRSGMPGRRATCCIASPVGCLPARKGIWGISRQFIYTISVPCRENRRPFLPWPSQWRQGAAFAASCADCLCPAMRITAFASPAARQTMREAPRRGQSIRSRRGASALSVPCRPCRAFSPLRPRSFRCRCA